MTTSAEPFSPMDTAIQTLGPCTVTSPARYQRFIGDEERVLFDLDASRVARACSEGRAPVGFERAGPRQKIFFEPAEVTAAIATCGGLCPGLNDVIRAVVHEFYYVYGVRKVLGVRYGYAGLNPDEGWPLMELTLDAVRTIHQDGGTVLGSSRGPQDPKVMVDTLEKNKVNILMVVGGDGTLKGAQAICQEVARRRRSIAVVGVPKTIDNDINLVSRSFGFETAVAASVEAIRCAHAEAEGAQNGVGIVKLMGRESGFVAASAALAQKDVNFVLIPEVPFDLDGPHGFLAALEARLRRRGHAVVVVAEGAGQNHFDRDLGKDASGNQKLGDIGQLLRDRIGAHLKAMKLPHSIKYIDPSYIIRSVPAIPSDCIFCGFLGQHAVHAGMAGKTNVMVGSWNNLFVHIPIPEAVRQRKHVDPNGGLWLSVLESTGQPERMVNTP